MKKLKNFLYKSFFLTIEYKGKDPQKMGAKAPQLRPPWLGYAVREMCWDIHRDVFEYTVF